MSHLQTQQHKIGKWSKLCKDTWTLLSSMKTKCESQQIFTVSGKLFKSYTKWHSSNELTLFIKIILDCSISVCHHGHCLKDLNVVPTLDHNWFFQSRRLSLLSFFSLSLVITLAISLSLSLVCVQDFLLKFPNSLAYWVTNAPSNKHYQNLRHYYVRFGLKYCYRGY